MTETTTEHVDYPHEPGRLYDCPACEGACHCRPGETECVFDGEHDPHSCEEFLVETGTSPSRSGAFEVWEECERCGSQRNRRSDSLL